MRILVIYTGGASGKNIEQQLHSYLELQLVAKVDITLLSDIAGADVPYSLSTDLAKEIYNHYKQYDGFVVIHSIDNAAYTANLLAFQLYPIGKPVIFTGTTIGEDFFAFPGNFTNAEQQMYREMSLRTSLVTAIQLATQDVAGVILAYGPNIVRAVRALEPTNLDDVGFASYQEEHIATVKFGIDLAHHGPKRTTDQPQLYAGVDPRIYVLQRMPQPILPPLETYSAILIHTGQDQLLPKQLALPSDRPIFLLGAAERKDVYTATALPAMAPLPALCKLMVGICHYHNGQLAEFMRTPVAGEFAAKERGQL